LTVSHPLRWTGLFLITYIAGGIAPDKWGGIVSAVSLLGLGMWLFLYLEDPHQFTKNAHFRPAHNGTYGRAVGESQPPILPVMGGCLRVCGVCLGHGLNSSLGFLVVKGCEFLHY